jgi:cation diffusion facilitator family transporter
MCKLQFEQTQDNTRQFKIVAACGLLASISLVIIKFTLGIIGHSYTVIADGVESISDTVTDITLLFGIGLWTAPADKNHPYGHYRIEAIVTAFVGIMLLLAACIITYKAVWGIIEGKRTDTVEGIALLAPITAIIIKESIYRWTISVSKKIKSTALYANAWHHRSDAITSVVSLIAVLIAILNPKFYIVDNIGGIICSILIIRIGLKIIIPALSELSDCGASEKIRKIIETTVLTLNKIKSTHKIRTRKMGSCIYADLHILIDGNISVKEGHKIAHGVQNILKETIPDLIDVVVHIEPYE